MNVAADGADPLLSAGRDRGLFRLGRLAAHQDKVLLAVVAEGADEVVGDGLPLIDVAADRADPLLFLRTLGLGLDAALIVAVAAGSHLRQPHRVGQFTDKQDMAAQVEVLRHLGGEVHVGLLGQVVQAVFAAGDVGKSVKLVHIPTGLHAKTLEQRELCVGGDGGNIEHAGVQDHVAGLVLADDRDGDAGGVVGHLDGGIDDAAVVLSILPGRE